MAVCHNFVISQMEMDLHAQRSEPHFWIEIMEQQVAYMHLNMLKQVFPTPAVVMFNNTKTTHSWHNLHVQMKPRLNDEFSPTYWNSAIFYT